MEFFNFYELPFKDLVCLKINIKKLNCLENYKKVFSSIKINKISQILNDKKLFTFKFLLRAEQYIGGSLFFQLQKFKLALNYLYTVSVKSQIKT